MTTIVRKPGALTPATAGRIEEKARPAKAGRFAARAPAIGGDTAARACGNRAGCPGRHVRAGSHASAYDMRETGPVTRATTGERGSLSGTPSADFVSFLLDSKTGHAPLRDPAPVSRIAIRSGAMIVHGRGSGPSQGLPRLGHAARA